MDEEDDVPRGLAYGMLIAIPLWVLISLGIYLWLR
jgi:hypothetical protein